MCDDLFNKIIAIQKDEDDELKKLLESAGFLYVATLMKFIKIVESNLDDVLQSDYEEIVSLIEDLFEKNKNPSEKDIRKVLKKRGFNKSFSKEVSPELIELLKEVATESNADFNYSKLSRASKKAMEKWLKELPDLMRLTTDDAVTNLISDLVESGEGIAKLEQLLSKLPEFSRRRARVTAITEGLSQYQAGTYEAMMQSDAVYGFEWLHTPGYKEPRKAHEDLHGTVIKKGAYFNVNGYLARYPLDPSLPAKERIQCHCHMKPVLDSKYFK